MKFPNVVLPDGPMPYADVGAALEQSIVTWDDLEWIRELWKGPIVVKGVHIGDDARRAIDAGAERRRRLEPRRTAARRRARDDARAAGSRRGGRRTDRGADRRRHPARQRHREGAVPRRARGADRPRLRVRAWRRRRRRRGARDRDSARRSDPHDQAARLPLHQRARHVCTSMCRETGSSIGPETDRSRRSTRVKPEAVIHAARAAALCSARHDPTSDSPIVFNVRRSSKSDLPRRRVASA